ncbi:carbohydrate kinase family protein [Salinarimonas rosea]|uniref:carbohydrate kinase family protein n=1 Tax=Salinarimonas rosea TaxID=552063 RepID=UPI00040A4A70|nr:PfkB family carbohydrate kinase [Salinarimonas rosea]
MSQRDRRTGAVLSVGRIYCDLVFTDLDAFPALGREVYARDLAIVAGGGAYIAAAHLAALGRATALVARLGLDRLSAGLDDELGASGVDLRFLDRARDAGPQVTVAIAAREERAFLTRRAGRARPATLERALAWGEAVHLHIAEYATLAEIPDLVSRAREHGLTVSLDPSWDDALIRAPGLIEACDGVDVFLPNLEEALAITGETSAPAALDVLAARFPLVALKAGPDGALLAAGAVRRHASARAVPVVDTTGAGDAFNAGLVHAWLAGAAPERILAEAIGAASVAVQGPGGRGALASSIPQARRGLA